MTRIVRLESGLASDRRGGDGGGEDREQGKESGDEHSERSVWVVGAEVRGCRVLVIDRDGICYRRGVRGL